MFTLLSKNENAVIVLHEIYGFNNHIKQTCKELHNSGLDVYCPNFLNREEPFKYDQHSQAIRLFYEVLRIRYINGLRFTDRNT